MIFERFDVDENDNVCVMIDAESVIFCIEEEKCMVKRRTKLSKNHDVKTFKNDNGGKLWLFTLF